MNNKNNLNVDTYPETVGPWGNSAKYFCDLCVGIESPEQAKKHFTSFLMDIVWNNKYKNLIFINNFLRTLGYNFYIYHHNGDPEKIGNELEAFHKKLENEAFRNDFIERIQKNIIEKVTDEDLGNFSSIFADFNAREIDLDEIANAVSTMDDNPGKVDESAVKIFGKLF